MVASTKARMIAIIRDIPLFSTLSRSDLREVARLCFEETYQPGDEIVRHLEDAQLMVVLLTGRARVSRDGKTLATLEPGDSAGEMSLIDGHRSSASVIVETPIEALSSTEPRSWRSSTEIL